MKMKFYGRTEELSAIRHEDSLMQERGSARMVVVTGRRRVGKTTLLLKAFADSDIPTIYFTVKRTQTEDVLTQVWMQSIAQKLNLDIEFLPYVDRLSQVVAYAMKISERQPVRFIIDECQELDYVAPGFWAELQEIWDLRKEKSKFLLMMSGSIASAIRHIFSDASEPLFGRPDLMMTLQPFNTSTVREVFQDICPNGEASDLLALYALTGGVARYLEWLSVVDPFNEKGYFDYIFSESGGWFRSEGENVLANEFRSDSQMYYLLLEAIANGSTQWHELQNLTKTPISPYLGRLEKQYGLVKKTYPLLQEKVTRCVRYQIADNYFRFWFKFIDPAMCRTLADSKQWTLLKQFSEHNFSTFTGRTLEQWFISAYIESGRWTQVGGWWDKRGENEIDIVAINAFDKRIEFVEVKRNQHKLDDNKLMKKAQAFLSVNPQMNHFGISFRGLSMENMLTHLDS